MELTHIASHAVGTMLSLVQAHFAATPAERAVSGAGARYMFEPEDLSASTIWIGDQFPDHDAMLRGEPKPAIVAHRGTMRFLSRTLGGSMRSMDFNTGAVEYSDIVPVPVALRCCSSNGIEAESLATEIAQLVFLKRNQIVRISKVQQVWEVVLGEEEALEVKGSQIEWAQVVVTVTCMMQAEFGLEPAEPEILRGSNEIFA